jgi:hypothetical protein
VVGQDALDRDAVIGEPRDSSLQHVDRRDGLPVAGDFGAGSERSVVEDCWGRRRRCSRSDRRSSGAHKSSACARLDRHSARRTEGLARGTVDATTDVSRPSEPNRASRPSKSRVPCGRRYGGRLAPFA